jgi:5-methylcytosine-specific restriction endonuclease McrA
MNARKANGHRRRQLKQRVFTEEDRCIICDQPVDKTLGQLPDGTWHPRSPVIDEDIPVSRGGSPTDRTNCHLAHRDCNRDKGNLTLAEHATRQQPNVGMQLTCLVDW